MALLILGVLLWSLPHLAKRAVPGFHRAMKGAERPMVAGLVIVSLVLMFFGWRAAEGADLWPRHPALAGVNNLLMLVSVYLFAVSGMKLWLARKIRHPQLTAVKIWAAAHLLVNPSVPGLVLFGGLLAWAVAEVILINRQTKWTPPGGAANIGREIGGLVGSVLLYGAIVWVHYWFGYPTFG